GQTSQTAASPDRFGTFAALRAANIPRRFHYGVEWGRIDTIRAETLTHRLPMPRGSRDGAPRQPGTDAAGDRRPRAGARRCGGPVAPRAQPGRLRPPRRDDLSRASPARTGRAVAERLVDGVGPQAPGLPPHRAWQAGGRPRPRGLASLLRGGRGGDGVSAFIERLDDELAARRVRRGIRRRIALEYADHGAPGPDAQGRLGGPGQPGGGVAC